MKQKANKYVFTTLEKELTRRGWYASYHARNNVDINYTGWHRLYINTSSIELRIARRQRHFSQTLIPTKAYSKPSRKWQVSKWYITLLQLQVPLFIFPSPIQVDTFQPLFAFGKFIQMVFRFYCFYFVLVMPFSSRSFLCWGKSFFFLFITKCRSVLEFVNNEKWQGFYTFKESRCCRKVLMPMRNVSKRFGGLIVTSDPEMSISSKFHLTFILILNCSLLRQIDLPASRVLQ